MSTEGLSEVVWSVKNGDMDSLKSFIRKGEIDINKEINGGRNALHFAADYGQTEIIEYLLTIGADVNLPDKHGITPLLAAIWENHVEAVKLLIEKGAKKDGKAPDGQLYIECAETDDMKNLLK